MGQLVTSNTLVWQNFVDDEKLLSSAVPAAQYRSETDNYPIYVCRGLTDGVIVAGHTKKHESGTICVVSMHTNVRTHHAFDVLLNKDNGAKLTWIAVNQFNSSIPTGAVSGTSDGHVSELKFQYNFYYN